MILTRRSVQRLILEGTSIRAAVVTDLEAGTESEVAGDLFFSTMPIQHLVRALGPTVPAEPLRVAEGLIYRDFLIVGLLLKGGLRSGARDKTALEDNWIYIHDPTVRAARLQIFNNGSPWMVESSERGWVGLLRAYLNAFENLVLLGRNGLHRYNNQDHSMLTAMIAVDDLVAGRDPRKSVWEVNTEPEYLEEASAKTPPGH